MQSGVLSKIASPTAWCGGSDCAALSCRQYHPEVTAVVQRLIDGVKSKPPGTLIDVANLAQVCMPAQPQGCQASTAAWVSQPARAC